MDLKFGLTMFRTKFKTFKYKGDFVVIYRKWYQLSWKVLEANDILFVYSTEENANFMIK